MQRPAIDLWLIKVRLKRGLGKLVRSVFGWLFVGAVFEETMRGIVTLLSSDTQAGAQLPLWNQFLLFVLPVLLFGQALLGRFATTVDRQHWEKRLHAIRVLQRSRDAFRRESLQAETEDQLQSRLEAVIRSALEEVDHHLLPDLSISLTLMRETEGNLKIIGYYPEEKEVNEDFTIPVGGNDGYARLAYSEAKSVYVPYVKRDWGVYVYAGNSAGEEAQFGSRKHRSIWLDSGRQDFRAMLSTPTLVVTQLAPYKAVPYGVLNLESRRRDAFKSDHFYCACIAANTIGQILAIDRERRAALPKK